jgi:hypothetical protein
MPKLIAFDNNKEVWEEARVQKMTMLLKSWQLISNKIKYPRAR